MQQFGLSSQIIADLRQAFSQAPGLEKVMIYGSRSTGSNKPYSDIDLAAFGANLKPLDYTQLWSRLEDLPIVLKVDLLHWDALENPVLKSRVLRDGSLFYSPQTNQPELRRNKSLEES